MLQAIDDLLRVIFDKNQITMPSHDFNVELSSLFVANFIATSYMKYDHTVKSNLFETLNESALKMFSKEHTKHWRFAWIVILLLCELHSSVARMSG